MKKQIKTLIYIVMAISLVACSFVGIRRIQVEQSYKEVEIAVRYSDVLKLMNETKLSYETILKLLKEAGATTLFVRENTVNSPIDTDLYSYKGLGDVSIVEGYILKFYYPDIEDVKPEDRYIVTNKSTVAENIFRSFTSKGIELEEIQKDGMFFIGIGDYSSELVTMGVGFDTEKLNTAASLGYSISAQLKSWMNVTPESIDLLKQELAGIDNLSTIYFADSYIPGPDNQQMIDLISEYQLGFVEFNSEKQKGFETLAKFSSELGKNYKVVRLHTLGDAQINTFTVPQLMDRYELALRERNNRVFLFKMPSSGIIEEDMNYLLESVKSFSDYATRAGYTLTGDVENYNLPAIPAYLAILTGLAGIMVFILLLAALGLEKLGYILGVVGIIGYIGLLKLNVTLASQLMALFGAIIFPTYAMYKGMSEKPKNIKDTILSLLKICVISYGGILTIIGCISRSSFALGINLFAGVKVATVAPIIIVACALIYQKHKLDIKYYKGVLDKKISYGALIVIAIIGGIFAIYVSRTGNTGTATGLELQFRQFLDNVLGVRPRTKEFLFAYPILMCLLYYGYKESRLIFVLLAAIGPTSLVNTYAHIHTPILISLLRSMYGIVLGIIIGLILIWIINLVSRVIKKWQIQTK